MPESIILTFTPKEQDYSSTLSYFLLHTRQTWIIIVIWGVMMLCVGRAVIAGDFGRGFYPGGVYLLALVVFILTYLLAPLSTRKKIRANPVFTSQVTFQIDTDQIIVKTIESETKFSWSSFSKVREVPGYYLFVYASNPRMFQFLPKRAFSSSDQEMAFRNLVKQQGKTIK